MEKQIIMGREIKRVALAFSHPLNKTWGGFLNPYDKHAGKCPDCDNGYSAEAARMHATWYGNWYGKPAFKPEDKGSRPWVPKDAPVRAFAERNVANSHSFYGSGEAAILREAERLCVMWNDQWMHHLDENDVAALVEANRLVDFTSEWTRGEGWKRKQNFVMPTPAEVNAWSLAGFGHDSINASVCVSAACERLGVPHTCATCGGTATQWDSPENEKLCEEWQPEEPPEGPGYQLWETVSEGSPISPVFIEPEELAAWLVTSPEYTWKNNDEGTTYEKWLAFIRGPGFAVSFVSDGGVPMTGVQFAAKEATK